VPVLLAAAAAADGDDDDDDDDDVDDVECVDDVDAAADDVGAAENPMAVNFLDPAQPVGMRGPKDQRKEVGLTSAIAVPIKDADGLCYVDGIGTAVLADAGAQDRVRRRKQVWATETVVADVFRTRTAR
jgi:hypothetical protein